MTRDSAPRVRTLARAAQRMGRCNGTGRHTGWRRGFLLNGGAWRCRVCKDRAVG